jgi:hypothetical protein
VNNPNPRPPNSGASTGHCSLPANEQALIREFMQALAEEIEAIKKGRGGSIITVYDGSFVRRGGPFFVYIFTTESPLIAIEDAETTVIPNARTVTRFVAATASALT